MGQPPVGPTCHGHKGRCLKASKHSPVGVVACVGRTRSTEPPTPPPPQKGRRQYKFALPRFGLKYLAAPIPALQNLSSPPSPSAPRLLKSLIRRHPSNRPSSRLFPHLCARRRRRRRRSRFTTAPELPHLCPRPPHQVVCR